MHRRRFLMFLMSCYRLIRACVKIAVKHVAGLDTAPPQEMAVDESISTAVSVPVALHDAEELTADNDITAAVQADTESAAGAIARARQTVWASVKSALVAYNRAAARYVKYILMPHTAEALSADGVTAESHTAQRTGKAGKAIRGAGLLAKIRNSFTDAHSANGTFASGEELTFEKLTAAEVTAAAVGADGAVVNTQALPLMAHRAKISFWWIYPVVIDGTLIIRQAYDPVQTGEILNIDSVAWASPVLTEDCLYIVQAHGETQNAGGVLEIEHLVWSNPEAVDGCLYIEQAYSTAQTDDELEVV